MGFHNLKLAPVNPLQHYTMIAKSKRKYKDILYGEDSSKSKTYSFVKQRYETYEKNKVCLEVIEPYEDFLDSVKKALLHSYNGSTKEVRKLKNTIINTQNTYFKTKCAYCGIGDTNHMDHYLPKELFPEYSVHGYNLVPCCSHCNQKKSTYFKDSKGKRMIFNPYFEVVKEPILICHIQCLDSEIKHTITLKEDIRKQVWLNHLSALNLIKRYESELPRIISSIIFDIISISEETGKNSDITINVLHRKLEYTEDTEGINSLNAIVYRAFLKNEQLFNIEYLNKVKHKL